MAQVQDAMFSCQSCKARYRWKPELAGKKVKCKCGAVMTAPAKSPVPAAAAAAKSKPMPANDEPDLDALYDLAEEGKAVAKAGAVEATMRCPSCKNEIEPGAVMCTSCGFNLKTGSKPSAKKAAAAAGAGMSAGRAPGGAAVATAGAKGGKGGAFAAYGAPKRGLVQESRGEDKVLDLFVPIGLIIIGMGLSVATSAWIDSVVVPVPQAALHAGMKAIMGFVLIAIGGIFCVQWGEIAFGEPGPAALKVAAMAIAPPAIAGIISIFVHDISFHGMKMIGFFLAFGMFFTLCHYLFEWDMSEKWIVTAMATIITMMVVPLLFALIVNTNSMPGVARGTTNEDKQIDYIVNDLGMPKPLNKWMDEAKGRIFGQFSRSDCEQLTNDLYSNSPRDGEIWVVVNGPQAAEIYVKMPKDDKKRKAMCDAITKWNSTHQRTPVTDNGGKWLIMTFMPFVRPEPVNVF